MCVNPPPLITGVWSCVLRLRHMHYLTLTSDPNLNPDLGFYTNSVAVCVCACVCVCVCVCVCTCLGTIPT